MRLLRYTASPRQCHKLGYSEHFSFRHEENQSETFRNVVDPIHIVKKEDLVQRISSQASLMKKYHKKLDQHGCLKISPLKTVDIFQPVSDHQVSDLVDNGALCTYDLKQGKKLWTHRGASGESECLRGALRLSSSAMQNDGFYPSVAGIHNPRRKGTTGGSSLFGAALVSLGLVDFAVGTNAAGSVRIPASFCGTVGLRLERGWGSANHGLTARCSTSLLWGLRKVFVSSNGDPLPELPPLPLRAVWLGVDASSKLPGAPDVSRDRSVVASGVRDAIDHARYHMQASGHWHWGCDVTVPDMSDATAIMWMNDAGRAAPLFHDAKISLEEKKVWQDCISASQKRIDESARKVHAVLSSSDVVIMPAVKCEPWSSGVAMPSVRFQKMSWPDTLWNPYLPLGNLGRILESARVGNTPHELQSDFERVSSCVVPCGVSPRTGLPVALNVMAMTRRGEPNFASMSRVIRACLAIEHFCGVMPLAFCPDLWFDGEKSPAVEGLWAAAMSNCERRR
jgi:hypothetical protein